MSLTLQVNGDIEERIEALVSGMCWAEELGICLEVYWWFLYPHIQCPFDRLFSRESLPKWLTIHGGMIESAEFIHSEQQFLAKGKPLVIKSKRRFYEKNSEKWLFYLRLLHPSNEIVHRMNLIPCRSSLGIYIQNLKEPPVARVLAEIWTNQRKASSFLLSTDCQESKRFLQLMFKDRLYEMIRASRPVNESFFLEKALDFFCFSQCSTILNFSQNNLMVLAAEYGNKNLVNL